MYKRQPENIAPFSVADVDMPLAPEIKNGLIKFLENDAVLGYTNPNDEYYQAVIDVYKRQPSNVACTFTRPLPNSFFIS